MTLHVYNFRDSTYAIHLISFAIFAYGALDL